MKRMPALLLALGMVFSPAPLCRGEENTGNKLPDLVITDITAGDGRIYVYYENRGAAAPGKFEIQVSAGKRTFSPKDYPMDIPAPGIVKKTGGFSKTLFGVEHSKSFAVTATIDWDNRVAEQDEKNNVFRKTITGQSTSSIVYRGGGITITELADGKFLLEAKKKGGGTVSFSAYTIEKLMYLIKNDQYLAKSGRLDDLLGSCRRLLVFYLKNPAFSSKRVEAFLIDAEKYPPDNKETLIDSYYAAINEFAKEGMAGKVAYCQRKIIELKKDLPGKAESGVGLINTYVYMQETDKALAASQKLLSSVPDDKKTRTDIGGACVATAGLLMAHRRIDDAQKLLHKVIAAIPEYKDAYQVSGLVYYLSGDYIPAKNRFEKYLAMCEKDPPVVERPRENARKLLKKIDEKLKK